MSGVTMMKLSQAAAWLPGARLVGDPATLISRVHTDTRSLMAGDLFVALKGEYFDANDFLTEARASGAVAAIAHRGLAEAGLAGFEVVDSLHALGAIAAGWRSQFALPLIAVTGSNGKTTVTQMLASILRAAHDNTLATVGNFNNEIGVPLTLLRLGAEHRLAVIELGMNHPGEIARLAAMTRPTVALVNNAQREHQEFMATVEAVACENAAVFDALPADGCAVFPQGDEFTPLWRALALRTSSTRRCMTFGDNSTVADVSLVAAQWQDSAWHIEAQTPQGPLVCTLRVAGHHNVMNALAATGSAMAAGIALSAIARGLSSFEPVKGRSQASTVRLASGRVLTLIDDSYNANPDSVRAAIDVLASLPGPRLLVLGDMGEVGTQSPEFHDEVGAYARARRIDALWALGADTTHSVNAFNSASAGTGFSEARHFADIDTLNSAVLARLQDTASVLVKGSRFMKMERVVQAIQIAAAPHSSSSSLTASHPEAGHAA